MTSFRDTLGIRVIATASAEQIGVLKHFVVEGGQVHALLVENSKQGDRLISWSDVTAIGSDAVIVDSDNVLRTASSDRESSAMRGELVLLDKRVLDDAGNDLGPVSDVTLNSATGAIQSLTVAGEVIAGKRLRSVGSYAVVITARTHR